MRDSLELPACARELLDRFVLLPEASTFSLDELFRLRHIPLTEYRGD